MSGELYNNRPATSHADVINNQFEDELFRLIDSALAQAEHLHESMKDKSGA